MTAIKIISSYALKNFMFANDERGQLDRNVHYS